MKSIKLTDMQAEIISDRLFQLTLGGSDELLSDCNISQDHIEHLYAACPKNQGLWFIEDSDWQFLFDEAEQETELTYDTYGFSAGYHKSMQGLMRKMEKENESN